MFYYAVLLSQLNLTSSSYTTSYLHFALVLHLGGLLLHTSQIQSFFGMSWTEVTWKDNNTELKDVVYTKKREGASLIGSVQP